MAGVQAPVRLGGALLRDAERGGGLAAVGEFCLLDEVCVDVGADLPIKIVGCRSLNRYLLSG